MSDESRANVWHDLQQRHVTNDQRQYRLTACIDAECDYCEHGFCYCYICTESLLVYDEVLRLLTVNIVFQFSFIRSEILSVRVPGMGQLQL